MDHQYIIFFSQYGNKIEIILSIISVRISFFFPVRKQNRNYPKYNPSTDIYFFFPVRKQNRNYPKYNTGILSYVRDTRDDAVCVL